MVFNFGATLSVAASAMLYTAANVASTFENNFNFSTIIKNNRDKNLLLFHQNSLKKITRCAYRDQQKENEQLVPKNNATGQQKLTQYSKNIVNRAIKGCDISHRYGSLFCRSGNWLEISTLPEENDNDNNTKNNNKRVYVRGTKHEASQFVILELIAVAFGLVSIRGIATENYLCMNKKGELYATPIDGYSSECIFREDMLENYYNLYSSSMYQTNNQSWYVALKRTGRVKKGNVAKKNQKSSHFLFLSFNVNNRKNIINQNNIVNDTFNIYNPKKPLIDSTLRKHLNNITRYHNNRLIFNSSYLQHVDVTPEKKKNFKRKNLQLSKKNNNGKYNITNNSLITFDISMENNVNFTENLHKINNLTSLNQKNYLNFTISDYNTNLSNFDKQKNFRKNIRRKKRLLREEKRRRKRRKELERLKKLSYKSF